MAGARGGEQCAKIINRILQRIQLRDGVLNMLELNFEWFDNVMCNGLIRGVVPSPSPV